MIISSIIQRNLRALQSSRAVNPPDAVPATDIDTRRLDELRRRIEERRIQRKLEAKAAGRIITV